MNNNFQSFDGAITFIQQSMLSAFLHDMHTCLVFLTKFNEKMFILFSQQSSIAVLISFCLIAETSE